jgi:hypothetical protein
MSLLSAAVEENQPGEHQTWRSSARAADVGGEAHVHTLLCRAVEGDEACTWRAMLFAGKPPTPLPVDAFLGTVVLEEKDHFVGRPLLCDLRIEIS